MSEETKENISSPISTVTTPPGRGISIGGNVIGSSVNTGDHNNISVSYQQAKLLAPETVDIKAELAALKEVLASLEFTDRKKVLNALDDAETEVQKPEPAKEEVGSAIERALGYAQKAEGFAKIIETLKPHLVSIASWLGMNYDTILSMVGLVISPR